MMPQAGVWRGAIWSCNKKGVGTDTNILTGGACEYGSPRGRRRGQSEGRAGSERRQRAPARPRPDPAAPPLSARACRGSDRPPARAPAPDAGAPAGGGSQTKTQHLGLKGPASTRADPAQERPTRSSLAIICLPCLDKGQRRTLGRGRNVVIKIVRRNRGWEACKCASSERRRASACVVVVVVQESRLTGLPLLLAVESVEGRHGVADILLRLDAHVEDGAVLARAQDVLVERALAALALGPEPREVDLVLRRRQQLLLVELADPRPAVLADGAIWEEGRGDESALRRSARRRT
jgi:hypothetical protein